MRPLLKGGCVEEGSWGKRSSLPQTRRFLTLLSQFCRDPAVGVRNAEARQGACRPRKEGRLLAESRGPDSPRALRVAAAVVVQAAHAGPLRTRGPWTGQPYFLVVRIFC